MTTLTRNEPFASREPTLAIDAGLLPGTHRFQLEVIDSSGLRSRPDTATLVVQRRIVGPPVLDPVIRPPLLDPVRPVVRPPLTGPVIRPLRRPRRPRPP